ncbi:hypothetical protein T11_13023 [Trichinella zimbabwensis]|uniref:Uncharacterized protein n=1 Tax=Trichinella zimbabwensis TaxID=268475 RepID=A0A0V1GR49_9BILA|nr:hypothetical protein T11_13023 [Trichinella zimbabwensis]
MRGRISRRFWNRFPEFHLWQQVRSVRVHLLPRSQLRTEYTFDFAGMHPHVDIISVIRRMKMIEPFFLFLSPQRQFIGLRFLFRCGDHLTDTARMLSFCGRFLGDGQHHVALLLYILVVLITTTIQRVEIPISPPTDTRAFFAHAQRSSSPGWVRLYPLRPLFTNVELANEATARCMPALLQDCSRSVAHVDWHPCSAILDGLEKNGSASRQSLVWFTPSSHLIRLAGSRLISSGSSIMATGSINHNSRSRKPRRTFSNDKLAHGITKAARMTSSVNGGTITTEGVAAPHMPYQSGFNFYTSSAVHTIFRLHCLAIPPF